MIRLTDVFAVFVTAVAVTVCAYTPLPLVPDPLTEGQLHLIEIEDSAEVFGIQQVGSMRVQLEPISVKPKPSSQPVQPLAEKPQRPKPIPPLKFPMTLIGIIHSGNRSVAVLQARDQRLYTLTEGDRLPAPHEAMQIEKIEAVAVTFRQGQQTVRVQTEPEVP